MIFVVVKSLLFLLFLHYITCQNNFCSNCTAQNVNKTNVDADGILNIIKSRRDIKLKENKLSLIRRKLQLNNGKERPLADARLEQNFSKPIQYGVDNEDQSYNKDNNKFRQLHNMHYPMREYGYMMPAEVECRFEEPCNWEWLTDLNEGFEVTTSKDYKPTDIGPMTDADNNTTGHFLLLRITSNSKELHVTSPLFMDSPSECRLEVSLYQRGMYHAAFKVVVESLNHTQWLAHEIPGDDDGSWKVYIFSIGRIKQLFRIILEVVPGSSPAYIALDNIKLIDCFPHSSSPICTPHQFRCMESDICINTTKICDITWDCKYGDDEIQNCDKMPIGARCNFEEDWCGWHNAENKVMQWSRHNGSTPTNKTGPNNDNTFKNTTGKYLYVNMANTQQLGAGFASSATINSVIFNPPPRVHGNVTSRYFNSCTIRFYYHQYGYHKSGIALLVTEMKPKENITNEIWWSHADHGDAWLRRTIILPNITNRYFLQFEARKGISSLSDVAIDDLSLSPECFGLNIPVDELQGYNYWNPSQFLDTTFKNEPHLDFYNTTYYEFSTCGVKGPIGPKPENCSKAYNNTAMNKVKVLPEGKLAGVQKWVAPQDELYTMIIYGASGGKGSSGMGSSRGAMVRAVIDLRFGQELYMLVGQEGTNACVKSLAHISNSSCESLKDSSHNLTGIRAVLNMRVIDGGGGGGGASYVFLKNGPKLIPLAVAAGGGGLGLGHFVDTGLQHGQAINMSRPRITGNMYGPDSAGAGGGWEMYKGLVAMEHVKLMGQSLVAGGQGGLACYSSTDGNGNGGFGGGGGGCNAGGGGGGYAGGNAWSKNTTNGEGGYSFIDPSLTIPKYSMARSGQHAGPGMIIIMPAIQGCGCDYRCIALDVRRSEVTCVCPKDWNIGENGKSCERETDEEKYPKTMITILIVIIVVLFFALGVLCINLYNKYQQRATGVLRRKMLSGPDLQLNRLRVASDSMMTEYNPNYEFGGVVYTLKDLKDIPRDQLRLVKALGQGAFGEVYQGFYRQRSGDAVEMPVAVKTLPEMSTNQAEMDFLMEALIMSKFNHPNIVHFIGVCFDKHPRFIVLELLAGGDLKNFLRESRPKPERGSSLTMKDLVYISIDVAKGCKYMEDNRFIHRDIAARNCLLTTKGPGRVVKIADFGMSRDIYRSDYYRKGGKAMLPIKWMPPEAFLDGIFTSKTDVWSFGVLLWEIMSMGYMPYTGCANRDVMQLVTSGGRLEPPANCPGPLYAIMTQCWHPNPEQRPNFSLILERLGYCAQDPQVMNVTLPVFNRLPSNERDTTVMRPENSDESYLKVPHAADYLIPNTNHPSEMQNSVSTSSVDKLIGNEPDNWETSFVMPHSKSTQPLLQESEQHSEETTNSTDKLISMESPPASAQSTLVATTNPTVTNSNHNNNTKTDNNIKNGVSLDACKLAKQNMPPTIQKKPYMNVVTSGSDTSTVAVTGNGVIPNGPYAISQTAQTRLNDSEISC